ncbi:hypothetical protein Fcan01_18564 [Folsomia candida]|uniref:U1-type domain-containing protein n=1 Tax=Folsomia candida TaxID=158441 RepID=A0A226DMM6_FOLCA|nr:hypothetical protein Fcan01_18564 [Folsomia candida]
MATDIFNDDWIQEEQFQGWLVKVSNDERRSYCRFCAIVLQARKGDLSAHGRTQAHIANAKIAQESGISTGPISVQIVCNEEENEDFTQPEEDAGGGGEIEYKPELFDTIRTRQKRTSTSGKNYIKKYRTAWEEEEEFKDWLQAYPDDAVAAEGWGAEGQYPHDYSIASPPHLKPLAPLSYNVKHDLSCHARTARHLKKIQEYKGDQFFMIAGDVVATSLASPIKRTLETSASSSAGGGEIGEIGIEIDTNGIFPDNGTPDGSPDDKRPRIIKMSKAHLKKESPKPFSRKKVRFTSADVVEAIENNEFTGYELLQIVKKAVPKL